MYCLSSSSVKYLRVKPLFLIIRELGSTSTDSRRFTYRASSSCFMAASKSWIYSGGTSVIFMVLPPAGFSLVN